MQCPERVRKLIAHPTPFLGEENSIPRESPLLALRSVGRRVGWCRQNETFYPFCSGILSLFHPLVAEAFQVASCDLPELFSFMD